MDRKVRKVETTPRLGWDLAQAMVAFLVVAAPVAIAIVTTHYSWGTLTVIAAVFIAAAIVVHGGRGMIERNRERPQRTVARRAQLDIWLTAAAENHARLQLGAGTRSPGAPGHDSESAYRLRLETTPNGTIGQVMTPLKGAPGAHAQQDSKGDNGEHVDGPQSPQGLPGANEPLGPKGDKGRGGP